MMHSVLREKGKKMADVVIRERTDEKGWIHRIEIPLKTFLREYDFEAVVRCKYCEHYWKNNPSEDVPVCLASPKDDAFCSEGERRKDGRFD